MNTIGCGFVHCNFKLLKRANEAFTTLHSSKELVRQFVQLAMRSSLHWPTKHDDTTFCSRDLRYDTHTHTSPPTEYQYYCNRKSHTKVHLFSTAVIMMLSWGCGVSHSNTYLAYGNAKVCSFESSSIYYFHFPVPQAEWSKIHNYMASAFEFHGHSLALPFWCFLTTAWYIAGQPQKWSLQCL